MIEAVVFDMDGLLVDSEPLWQRARIEAFGADRLRWTEADQKRVMGSSTLAWARQIQEKIGDSYPLEAIIERVLGQMVALYRQGVPLMPGASEIVNLLRGRYPLGLASGSPYRLIEVVLQQTGWDSASPPTTCRAANPLLTSPWPVPGGWACPTNALPSSKIRPTAFWRHWKPEAR